MNGPPTLLRNVSDSKNHWLSIKLVGDVSRKTPKDAVGSTFFVTTGRLRQRFDITSGAGYASQSSQTINVGLGAAVKIDDFEVHWANGQPEKFTIDKIDTQFVARQGRGAQK
jgi:hypothetical protein